MRGGTEQRPADAGRGTEPQPQGRPATGGHGMRDVQALVFDIFGTVVDWRSGIMREAAALLSRHGADPARAGAFADAWRARYQPAMQAIRSGARPFARLDVLHAENLAAILPDFGLSPDAEAAAALVLAWHRLDPWPDVAAGLARLRGRFLLAPLSNGNLRLMVDLARRADLRWDAILGAELSRAYKPAPEVYLDAAAALGLAPGQLCMVAAHNDDLAAARALGLRTAFVLRPTEHGPAQTTDLRPEQDWDIVAGDFGELADRAGLPQAWAG